MRAYSQDLRERVLRAVDEGQSRPQIIDLFQVSAATIKRYRKQRRETGNVQPRPIPGRTPQKGAALQAEVGALIEAQPDARLEDYCQMWQERSGVRVSLSTMSRALRRAGSTRKKRRQEQASAKKRSDPPGASRCARLMPGGW